MLLLSDSRTVREGRTRGTETSHRLEVGPTQMGWYRWPFRGMAEHKDALQGGHPTH